MKFVEFQNPPFQTVTAWYATLGLCEADALAIAESHVQTAKKDVIYLFCITLIHIRV